MGDLEQILYESRRAGETTIAAEQCRVVNTVTEEGEEVRVVLVNGEAPGLAEPVAYWRLQFGLDDEDNIVPRYPQRGDTGLAIYTDTDEIWLIY